MDQSSFSDINNKLVQRYVLMERIGYGSHGSVFKAFDIESGRTVAVKVIRAKINDSWRQDTLPYLSRELNALFDLSQPGNQHRNIIRLMDSDLIQVNDNESHVWVVLEAMACDLWEYIETLNLRAEVMPMQDIKRYSYQVLLGLAHLHERGYIHKDIKPNNVLLRGNVAKIADFGLSIKVTDQAALPMDRVGTVSYRPPELLMRSQPYGRTGDAWGVGVLICEMAVGKEMFQGQNEREVLESILETMGAPDLTHVPAPFREIAAKYTHHRNVEPIANFPVLLHRLDWHGLALVRGLLSVDWENRTTVQIALQSPFFDDVRDS